MQRSSKMLATPSEQMVNTNLIMKCATSGHLAHLQYFDCACAEIDVRLIQVIQDDKASSHF